MTDAELVELARGGDAAAFGELVERHRSAVYRAALAACRSHQDAEEVAQDAFVAAWQKLGGFRGDAQFRTWILAIAWRRALDRRESLWRRMRRLVSAEEMDGPALVHPGPSAVETIAAARLVDDVRASVGRLPAKMRDPLLLLAAGVDYQEMSAMLGAPVGTLKWRVSEARRRLKVLLAARGYEVDQ